MPSIGQQLSLARKTRDLTIEDVAFHTRIPAGRVRDLENDDLSRFANLTYARGFLKIYSRFLDLDISDYLDQFSSSEFATASGHEYVQTANATHNLPAAVITDYGRSRQPGLYLLIAGVLAAGGIVWWNNRSGTPEVQRNERSSSAPALAKPEPPPTTTPAVSKSPPTLPPAVPTVPEAVPPQAPAKPPRAVVVEDEEEPKKEP